MRTFRMYAANDRSLDAVLDDPRPPEETELFRLGPAISRSVECRLRPEEDAGAWEEGPAPEDEAAAAERKLLEDLRLSLPVVDAGRSLRVPPLLPISMDLLLSTSRTPLCDPRATLMGV